MTGGVLLYGMLVNANKMKRGRPCENANPMCKFQCIGEGWDSYFGNRGVGVRGNWWAKSVWGWALRFRSVTELI